jgi:hypothetical protein
MLEKGWVESVFCEIPPLHLHGCQCWFYAKCHEMKPKLPIVVLGAGYIRHNIREMREDGIVPAK